MTCEFKEFKFNGAVIRVTRIDGVAWFVMQDVCKALGLGNPSKNAECLDRAERMTLTWSDRNRRGGARSRLVISKPGLFHILMRSDKPNAQPFQRWLSHEVLPQIDETGAYIPGGRLPPPEFDGSQGPDFDNPEVMQQLLLVHLQKSIALKAALDATKVKMRAVQEANGRLLGRNAVTEYELNEAEKKLTDLAPKIDAVERFERDIDDVCMTDAGKLAGMSRAETFPFLSGPANWIFRYAGAKAWSMTEHARLAGYIRIRTHTQILDDGREIERKQIVVTARGQIKLAELVHAHKRAPSEIHAHQTMQ